MADEEGEIWQRIDDTLRAAWEERELPKVAALIAESLRESAVSVGCLVDAKDLKDVVIDGHFDLVKAAKLVLERMPIDGSESHE